MTDLQDSRTKEIFVVFDDLLTFKVRTFDIRGRIL